jgi:hypothetical protein
MNCPNCNSLNYINLATFEKCSDCGLECCYSGGGANDVYNRMMDRIEYERIRKEEKLEFEQWGIDNGFW